LPKDDKAQHFANLFEGYEFAHERRLGILSKHPIERKHNWNVGTRGRYVLGAEITVADRTLLVIDVHLQHFPADDLSAVSSAARSKFEETAALESLIAKHKGSQLILAGDLNSSPQGSVNRMLRKHLADSFAVTSRGFGFTIPASLPMRRIDYIYVGNGFDPIRSFVAKDVVSDHLAVVGDVSLEID
jgi:vancomycin resistance protein VanJ